nr:hypothetical protein [Desulforamulus aquiferis]
MKKIQLGFNNPEQRHSKQWKQRFAKLRMRKPEVNTMFTRRRPIFARSKGLALSTAEIGVVRDY